MTVKELVDKINKELKAFEESGDWKRLRGAGRFFVQLRVRAAVSRREHLTAIAEGLKGGGEE